MNVEIHKEAICTPAGTGWGPRLPTLTDSQELKNLYFTMKFFPPHHLHVNNMWIQFQGQKMYQKKDIQNLPTCVDVKSISMLLTLTEP